MTHPFTRWRRASLLPALGATAASAQSAATPPAATPPAAPLRLFLLVGQSDMAGRGTVEAEDRAPVAHVWMLNQALAWVPAVDPVHFDKPKVVGVGPYDDALARAKVARARGSLAGILWLQGDSATRFTTTPHQRARSDAATQRSI